MKISIYSRVELAELLKKEPNIHDCIVIRSPKEENYPEPDEEDYSVRYRLRVAQAYHEMKDLWKRCLELAFDDAVTYNIRWTLAKKEDIEGVLKFCEGMEDVKLACAGGVSRSSALAYVIARSKMEKGEALKVLDKDRHRPNDYILELGEEILKLPLKKELKEANFHFISE